MSEIDWSKAPEGAEFWCEMQWFKTVNGEWRVWCPGVNSWVQPSYAAPDNFSWWGNAVERPDSPQWTGTGLPPVGTVCEVLWNESRMEYLRTKVFGVNEHGQPIHRFDEGPKKFEYQADPTVTVFGTKVFRPIRTQAQIEAEEREKELSHFAYVLYRDVGMERSDAELLWNKGYRKQGEAK